MQSTRSDPKYLLRLDTAEPRDRSTYLEIDYGHLRMMVETLQQAEAEHRSVHARRMLEYIR
jgi:hypothetical protein